MAQEVQAYYIIEHLKHYHKNFLFMLSIKEGKDYQVEILSDIIQSYLHHLYNPKNSMWMEYNNGEKFKI